MINDLKIGIYGIKGSGKTTLAKKICKMDQIFKYIEGKDVIDAVTPDGLTGFNTLSDIEKKQYRESAINRLFEIQGETGKNLLVVGHYSFYTEDKGKIQSIITDADKKFYTNIYYLHPSPEEIQRRNGLDLEKTRDYTLNEIQNWLEFEKTINGHCSEKGIKIKYIYNHDIESNAKTIINDAYEEIKINNYKQALIHIKKIIEESNKKTFVLFDADYTLFPYDSGKIFCKSAKFDFIQIKEIFQSRGYSFPAFYKSATLHAQMDADTFNKASEETAKQIIIEKDFIDFIDEIKKNVEIVVITAGYKKIWEQVLHNHKLDGVHLIAGNNLRTDEYIIDNTVKGLIVEKIKENDRRVIAYGDSLVDYPMLNAADISYIIIYEKERKDLIEKMKNDSRIKQIPMREMTVPHLRNISFHEMKKEIWRTLNADKQFCR